MPSFLLFLMFLWSFPQTVTHICNLTGYLSARESFNKVDRVRANASKKKCPVNHQGPQQVSNVYLLDLISILVCRKTFDGCLAGNTFRYHLKDSGHTKIARQELESLLRTEVISKQSAKLLPIQGSEFQGHSSE